MRRTRGVAFSVRCAARKACVFNMRVRRALFPLTKNGLAAYTARPFAFIRRAIEGGTKTECTRKRSRAARRTCTITPRALASFEMFAYAFFTPMFDFDSTMTHPTISTMPIPRETHGVPVKPAIT